MLASLIRSILALIGLALIVLFAIANRGLVPVDILIVRGAVSVPVYALFLAGMLTGVALGGIAMWVGGWRGRHDGKIARRELKKIETRDAQDRRRAEAAQQAERKARRQQLALASEPR